VIGDLVQSIGVLVAATIIHFTEFKLADPICTFLFSIIVLITTAGVLRDVLMVLLEGLVL
jgi:Co/Zn/Cd efflux system component